MTTKNALRQMTDAEIGYVAGLFEGEGYVGPCGSKNSGKKRSMQLRIKMTDLSPLERCHEYTGIGNISGPHAGTNKVNWVWCVYGWNPLYDLYMALKPWLSERRQIQWEGALLETVPTYKFEESSERYSALLDSWAEQ